MAEKRKVKNPGKLFCRLMAYISGNTELPASWYLSLLY